MGIYDVIAANMTSSGSLLCTLLAAVMGAYIGYIKPDHVGLRNVLFFVVVPVFLVGALFAARDKSVDNKYKSQQREALLSLSKGADDIKNKQKDTLDQLTRTAALSGSLDNALIKLKNAEDKIGKLDDDSHKLQDNLDIAMATLADSVDRLGEQMTAQLKRNFSTVVAEMRKSNTLSARQIQEFAASSDAKVEQFSSDMRNTTNQIRSSQFMSQSPGPYSGYGYGYNGGYSLNSQPDAPHISPLVIGKRPYGGF